MEIVQLLVFLLGLVAVLCLIYLVVYLAFSKKQEEEIEVIFKKSVTGTHDCKKCGADCSKFSKGLVKGEFALSQCPNISKDKKQELTELLDLKLETNADKVAYVCCKGGNRATEDFNYQGVNGCGYMNSVYNGVKNCKYACLGCMDCAKVCPTNAIFKNDAGVAEIDRSMCIGCGACTKVCPDKLIKMIPLDQEIGFACKYCINDQVNTEINKVCAVGCSKCCACETACPTGAISFTADGRMHFNKEKCTGCKECVKACPNNTINVVISEFDKI